MSKSRIKKSLVDPNKKIVTVLAPDLDGTTVAIMHHEQFTSKAILAEAKACDLLVPITHRCLLTMPLLMNNYLNFFDNYLAPKSKLIKSENRSGYKVDHYRYGNMTLEIWKRGNNRFIPFFMTFSIIERLEKLSDKTCLAVSTSDDLNKRKNHPPGYGFKILTQYEESFFAEKLLLTRGLDQSGFETASIDKNEQLLKVARYVESYCAEAFPAAESIIIKFPDDCLDIIELSPQALSNDKWPKKVGLISYHCENSTEGCKLIKKFDSTSPPVEPVHSPLVALHMHAKRVSETTNEEKVNSIVKPTKRLRQY